MYSQNFNVQTNIRKRFISQIRERLTLIHNKKGIPHTDKIPIAAEALFLLQGNQEAIVPKESLRLYIKMMQSDDMNLFLESAEKFRQRIDAETLRDLIWFQHHLTYQNAPDLLSRSINQIRQDLDNGFFNTLPDGIFKKLANSLANSNFVLYLTKSPKFPSLLWLMAHPDVRLDYFLEPRIKNALPQCFDHEQQIGKFLNLTQSYIYTSNLMSLRNAYGLLVGNFLWTEVFNESEQKTLIDVLIQGYWQGLFEECDMNAIHWGDFSENCTNPDIWKWAVWYYAVSDCPNYADDVELDHAADNLSYHADNIKDLQVLLFIWASFRFDSPLLGEDLIKQVTAQRDSLLRQFNALSIPLSHLEVQLKGNKIILSDKYKAVNKLLAAF